MSQIKYSEKWVRSNRTILVPSTKHIIKEWLGKSFIPSMGHPLHKHAIAFFIFVFTYITILNFMFMEWYFDLTKFLKFSDNFLGDIWRKKNILRGIGY